MNKIIITTPEELQQLIAQTLKLALKEIDRGELNIANTASPYLTISEAADYLNLAKQTLYGFTSARKIPFIKRAKRLLFVKSELDAWLVEGKKLSIRQLQAS